MSPSAGMLWDNILPRWAIMWAISFAIYGLAKLMSWLPARGLAVSRARLAGYFLAWPGLDAEGFLTKPAATRPATGEWLLAGAKTAFGLALLTIGAMSTNSIAPYWAGWIGMVGIVFTFHFGVFHLLSCYWRAFGVNAPLLMDWPVLSRSVSEFWGKRWNRAFRDLTHRFVFRPLIARCGLAMGTLLAFFFSGAIHELAITVPAGGGYGRPTVYFLLQGAGLLAERSRLGKSIGLGDGIVGRVFAIGVTALPVGLLFPRPFVVEIMAPFLRAMGSVLWTSR